MSLQRLLIPLAVLTPLALASPAVAFDWPTEVVDFEFKPAERRIALGDSVSWNFTAGGHTSTSLRGQPDSWNSVPAGTNAAGSSYTKVFNTPGRYQYMCIPHQSFMKGVIEVGIVTYRLKGPTRRTVKRGRLDAGTHSFTLRRLKRGTYRGVLTVVDDFDKKITPRNFFVIR